MKLKPSPLQSTPPIPVGSMDCGPACPILPTPSSNTGSVTHRAGAIVDFLSFTALLASLPLLPSSQYRRDTKLSFDLQTWEPQEILDWAMPACPIRALAFVERGRFGYTRSSELIVPGVGAVGFLLAGGNNGTFCISISGSGCPFIGDAKTLADALERIRANITRVDLAFDDFHAEYLDIGWLINLAREGFFDYQGTRRTRRLVDDLGSLTGRSLYVGRKGQKELCIYEKGKQLQSFNSVWVRAEVRLWAKNRVIPYDVLTSPGSYLRGECPEISNMLPAFTPLRSQVMKKEIEAKAEAAHRWIREAAGKTLGMFAEAAERADVSAAEFLQSVVRPGMPARFAGLPDFVVYPRIAHTMRKENVEAQS